MRARRRTSPPQYATHDGPHRRRPVTVSGPAAASVWQREQRTTFAGRLRRPLPQATGSGFGAEIASTHAQRGRAASGPDSRGKGAEPVRTRRPTNIRGKASSNGLDSSDESVMAGGSMEFKIPRFINIVFKCVGIALDFCQVPWGLKK